MTEPQLHHLHCKDSTGTHRMGYWQWGQSDAQAVVLCVHGLTRQGRDFDVLARALLQAAQAQGRSLRLICPDVVGRGSSDWLADPALYQPLTYLADMQALLVHLHAQAPIATLDWVGTSMGGIIGMLAASQPQALVQPIRRLLLNDVDGAHLDYEIILNILAEPRGGSPQNDNEPKVAIVMCISETYVPRARRGRGLGAQLASAAFAIAAVRGWLVWPKCSYISDSFLGVDPEPTSADGKPLASLVVTPNQKGNPHLVLAAH